MLIKCWWLLQQNVQANPPSNSPFGGMDLSAIFNNPALMNMVRIALLLRYVAVTILSIAKHFLHLWIIMHLLLLPGVS